MDFVNLDFSFGNIEINDVEEKKEFEEIDKKIRSLGNYGCIKHNMKSFIEISRIIRVINN